MGRKCLFHFDMERISTFSAIEKALAGRKKSFRGSYVVQACTDVTLLVTSIFGNFFCKSHFAEGLSVFSIKKVADTIRIFCRVYGLFIQ